jgi:probable HAF family extracellular repeat protein
MSMRTCLAFGIAVTGFCFPSMAQIFSGIGVPDGFINSHATAISGDGATAVGWVDAGFSTASQGFRWSSPAGTQILALQDGMFWSRAYDVSYDGSIIVGSQNSFPDYTAYHAASWTNGGASHAIPGTESLESNAFAISDNGRTIVGTTGMTLSMAFRYTEDTGLVTPNVSVTYGHGVSPDGSIALGSRPLIAFRWAEGGELDPIDLRRANAITSGGLIVGDIYAGSTTEAALWSDATGLQELGRLDGQRDSAAVAVSADGSIVVGYSGTRAFLWTSDLGMVDLNAYLTGLGIDLTGWTLNNAADISADGLTIVGTGIHEYAPGLTRTEGWVVTIPSPGAAMLLLPLLVQRRRRT